MEVAVRTISVRKMLVYHDRLFFKMAYPENINQYESAKAALNELCNKFSKMVQGSQVKTAINGSGIPGSCISGLFSYAIAKWLTENFPADAEIDGSAADVETIRIFFRAVLPRNEYENISAGNHPLAKRIKKIRGKANSSMLSWLIELLESSGLNTRVKESLFHSLQIFILWKLNHPVYNRTRLRGFATPTFLHKRLIKKINPGKIIMEGLPLPVPLTDPQKTHLINAARSTLAFLYRETEPFTYADEKEVTYFELDRGFSFALYGMSNERRLSIESYIGYLVFKNGIPVAYGGGWIFGHRCQFGINILPPFRGGESFFLFSQVLRIYKNYYSIERFAVKPYQFGKTNIEALKSGAIWFYYKAGFRPESNEIRKFMATEWQKIEKDSQYRTPLSQLKKMTGSNLLLLFKNQSYPAFDAADISRQISSYINIRFQGNRLKAIKSSVILTKKQLGVSSLKNWDIYEKRIFGEWSLLIQACLQLKNWSAREKKELSRLIKAKGSGTERDFVFLLQQHTCFWRDLNKKIKE